MSVKDQFAKMKENWLMIVLFVVLFIFVSGGSNMLGGSLDSIANYERGFDGKYMASVDTEYSGGYYGYDEGFAPEIEDRKITKTSSMSTEVERGEFGEAENTLKNIITSSDAYLLNERVNRNGEGWKSYLYGYYSLKVDTEKYDSVVAQLKEIGEVQSFTENMADVTERYNDAEVELAAEKTRLQRYLEMYDEANDVSDQIELNDRIFDQERRIKYLEESLENIDGRIDYSTISFSMTEERSSWTNIAFVKVSDLVRSFVDSLNTLLSFIFGIIPWAIAFFAGLYIWKRFKK